MSVNSQIAVTFYRNACDNQDRFVQVVTLFLTVLKLSKNMFIVAEKLKKYSKVIAEEFN